MIFYKPSALLLLFASLIFLAGCKSGNTKPSNPFAQNLQTVPPPATFSSQESYLGQMPGSFVPQTPATVFPPSGSIPPVQPTTSANVPLSDAANNDTGKGATLFAAAEKDTGWLPVEVVSTSQTAFQAMDAKVNAASSVSVGTQTDVPESLIVGTSHVVTTVTDEPQPVATLSEPQLLYAGGYAE